MHVMCLCMCQCHKGWGGGGAWDVLSPGPLQLCIVVNRVHGSQQYSTFMMLAEIIQKDLCMCVV